MSSTNDNTDFTNVEAALDTFNEEFKKLERNLSALAEQNSKISRFIKQQNAIFKK
jgi:hypothetical protein